ncbi:MAG: glycerophosphodiester phosphodiesterase [Gammaproteobacteria bacterium]|jgi:glycerophosphoryl diester phosphodiesterase|nr:glycerophosphodiester phosphodiesterase [Gammaproteobacteria bacterium]
MALKRPIVIAHRGASGYLPEHTLAAKAMAHAMEADFIEQDVVLTRDAVPIVLHDIVLDSTTDVAQKFPGRARKDGHFYAMDFLLEEVQQLRAHERRTAASGYRSAAFPGRFPTGAALFGVPTLAQEIDLIEGLNKSRNKKAGFYIEFKSPNKHLENKLDVVAAVLDVLQEKGLAQQADRVYLQCFDDKPLIRLKHEFQSPLPRIQLIADNSWGEDSALDYDVLRSTAGLDHVATYADGIGPWISHIYLGRDDQDSPLVDDLVARAQASGLLVHPYTFRDDSLPGGMTTTAQLLELLIHKLGIDGLFADFPDTVVQFLDRTTL